MQLLAQSDTDGYYMTLGEEYPWGSNMTAADHGNLLPRWQFTGIHH